MGNLTGQGAPSVFVLPEEQHFLLGDLMRPDGAGFLKLDGVSVMLVGEGSGATLDAEHQGRLFYVTSGNLTLTNLRVVNGLATARAATRPHPSCLDLRKAPAALHPDDTDVR